VPAIFCFNDRLVKEIREIIHVPIRPKNHVAAASAIATVRATPRYKFLTPKTDAPAPALSGLCKNFDSIDEHCFAALNC
jgi:hypothetical protein